MARHIWSESPLWSYIMELYSVSLDGYEYSFDELVTSGVRHIVSSPRGLMAVCIWYFRDVRAIAISTCAGHFDWLELISAQLGPRVWSSRRL
jgi:hypothetical protein